MTHLSRRQAVHAFSAAALGGLTGLPRQAWSGQCALRAPRPSGRVVIRQTEFALIGSMSSGDGTLYFRRRSYPFLISGLGIGGVGVSTLDASGDVYGLVRLSDMEGSYGQGRAGWALMRLGDGHLWLENQKGVVLRLAAQRKGLMLAAGADLVHIQLR